MLIWKYRYPFSIFILLITHACNYSWLQNCVHYILSRIFSKAHIWFCLQLISINSTYKVITEVFEKMFQTPSFYLSEWFNSICKCIMFRLKHRYVSFTILLVDLSGRLTEINCTTVSPFLSWSQVQSCEPMPHL